jgi:hypothetical protein
MIVNSFQISDELQMVPIDHERAAQAGQIRDARIWLDVQTAELAEIEAWLDTLEIRAFSRRLCLEASDRSGYYMYLYFRRTGWFD